MHACHFVLRIYFMVQLPETCCTVEMGMPSVHSVVQVRVREESPDSQLAQYLLILWVLDLSPLVNDSVQSLLSLMLLQSPLCLAHSGTIQKALKNCFMLGSTSISFWLCFHEKGNRQKRSQVLRGIKENYYRDLAFSHDYLSFLPPMFSSHLCWENSVELDQVGKSQLHWNF